MTPEDLDRILSSRDTIQPSSAFTRNVMAAVHRAAEDEQPVPFPWLRFAVGVGASGVMAAAGTVLLTQSGISAASLPAFVAPVAGIGFELACTAGAIVLTTAIALIPRFLSRS